MQHLSCHWVKKSEAQALFNEETLDLGIEIKGFTVSTEGMEKVMDQKKNTEEVILKTDEEPGEMGITGQIQETVDINPGLTIEGT